MLPFLQNIAHFTALRGVMTVVIAGVVLWGYGHRGYGQQTGASWQPKELLAMAGTDLGDGLIERTVTALDQVAGYVNTPYQAEAWLLRGRAALARGEYGEARFYCNQAMKAAETHDNADVAGQALYMIGLSHAAEPNSPFLPQGTAALQASAQTYPAGARAAQAFLALGLTAESKGDLLSALDYYNTVITQYPGSPCQAQAHIRSAGCLLGLDNPNHALIHIQRCRTILIPPPQRNGSADATNVERQTAALLRLEGEATRVLGDYPAAERAFRAAAGSAPSARERRMLNLELADTYMAAGSADSALIIYEQLLQAGDNDRAGQNADYCRAIALLRLGRDPQAEQRLRQIADSAAHPNTIDAGLTLGARLYLRADYPAATKEFAAACTKATVNSAQARARLLLGLSLLAQDSAGNAYTELDRAERAARSAGRTSPGNQSDIIATAQGFKAVALVRARRAGEAVPELSQLLNTAPQATTRPDQSLFWLADAYYQSQLLTAAVESSNDLLQRYPNSHYAPEALYTGGWALLRQRRYNQAGELFGRLATQYPAHPNAGEAALRQADCKYLSRHYAAAADAYAAAITATSTGNRRHINEYACYQLGVALRKAGLYDEATQAFGTYLQAYPNGALAADAQLLRGLIALDQQQYDDAIAGFSRMIASQKNIPLLPRAYYGMGRAFQETGDFGYALAAYSLADEAGRTGKYGAAARRATTEMLAALKGQDQEPPATPERNAMRADILADAGLYTQALAAYRAADGTQDSYLQQRSILGQARSHNGLGNQAEALRLMAGFAPDTASGAVPLQPDLVFYLAGLRVLTGRADLAAGCVNTLRRQYANDTALATAQPAIEDRPALLRAADKCIAALNTAPHDTAAAAGIMFQYARQFRQNQKILAPPPHNRKELQGQNAVGQNTTATASAAGQRVRTTGALTGTDGGSSVRVTTLPTDEPTDLSALLFSDAQPVAESFPVTKQPAPPPPPLSAPELETFTARGDRASRAVDQPDMVLQDMLWHETTSLPKSTLRLDALAGIYTTATLGAQYTYGQNNFALITGLRYHSTNGDASGRDLRTVQASARSTYNFGDQASALFNHAKAGAALEATTCSYNLYADPLALPRSQTRWQAALNYGNRIDDIDWTADISYNAFRLEDNTAPVADNAIQSALQARTQWNGVQLQAATLARLTTPGAASGNYIRLNGAVGYATDWLKGLLTLGVTAAQNPDKSYNVSPLTALELNFYPGTALTLGLKAGMGLRQPEASQVLEQNPWAGSLQNGLRPEIEGFGAGVHARFEPSESFAVQASVTAQYLKDCLYFGQLNAGTLAVQYANARITTAGGDAYWTIDELNYVQMQARYVNAGMGTSYSAELPYRSGIDARALYTRTLNPLPLDLTAGAHYIGPRSGAGGLGLQPALLADLTVRYRLIKNIDLQATVQNILNTAYQTWEGYTAPGIFFGAGVRAAF